ncbi:hypothetical protein HIM_03626 [Hirsutella minnesotensis 3608]|uniref:Peptidase S8/S53 domain-containing protein n=1 Tax=Hirsutella minnesotensis 3608 TaxID=1043627 RepID=A0A0F8A6A7_9HYPO|nr:hypothetical protein HIM_03626 [Hirsutella minnesotensis 3608]
MRIQVFSLAVALFIETEAHRHRRATGGSTRGIVSGQKYIVELQPGIGRSKIASQTAQGPSHILGAPKVFNCSGLFNGLVIEPKKGDLDSLRKIEGVVNAWPVRTVSLPSSVMHSSKAASPPTGNYSIHQWTGVDRLHKAGIKGKGVKIAVIDTGLDYTHEALGGCLGPGCKIIGGYDYVGDPFLDGLYPVQPDLDPMDHHGHGTHVAGIIGANATQTTGVAPEAHLLAYKIFPDIMTNGTSDEVLIQAFCDAYAAGADIISSSVGLGAGFSDSVLSLLANRLVDQGVLVTMSAGNDGSEGPFFSGDASNGRGVLSVAAVNVSGDPFIGSGNSSAHAALFNSWGPTNELLMKPDIAAPGVQITSTLLNQTFGPMDGTSMAAPYVAGIGALYISHHGGRNTHGPGFARELAWRIIASGRSVSWYTGTAYPNETAPPFQVGTGLVDAHKVLYYTTQLKFESISLLDTELFKPDWNVEIWNRGKESVQYRFEVEPQAAVEIYNGRDGIKSFDQLQPSHAVPFVSLPPTQTLKAGDKAVVTLRFSPPKNVSDDLLPLYGGKIWVKGSNGEELCIPYGGAAYDTEKAFDSMLQEANVTSARNDTQTWFLATDENPPDHIGVKIRLGYPCVHLRWDIFASNWTERQWEYPPNHNNGYVGSATTIRDAERLFDLDLVTSNTSDVVGFPMTRVARGTLAYRWFGKLANGSTIAPGNYTVRFAALRPYGNPRLSDHWDIVDLGTRKIQVTTLRPKVRKRRFGFRFWPWG